MEECVHVNAMNPRTNLFGFGTVINQHRDEFQSCVKSESEKCVKLDVPE